MIAYTPRQLRIMEIIHEVRKKHGYSPTYEELGRRLGGLNRVTIMQHVHKIINKGGLRKIGNGARALLPIDPRFSDYNTEERVRDLELLLSDVCQSQTVALGQPVVDQLPPAIRERVRNYYQEKGT